MERFHSKQIRINLLACGEAGVIYGIVDRRQGRRENHDRLLLRGYLAGHVLEGEPQAIADLLTHLAQEVRGR